MSDQGFKPNREWERIELREMVFAAHIGVTRSERAEPQPLIVDLTLWMNLEPAGAADDLTLTLDYREAQNLLRDLIDELRPRLLERFTLRSLEALFERFPDVAGAEIVARKPNALPDTAHAAVRMTRWREL